MAGCSLVVLGARTSTLVTGLSLPVPSDRAGSDQRWARPPPEAAISNSEPPNDARSSPPPDDGRASNLRYGPSSPGQEDHLEQPKPAQVPGPGCSPQEWSRLLTRGSVTDTQRGKVATSSIGRSFLAGFEYDGEIGGPQVSSQDAGSPTRLENGSAEVSTEGSTSERKTGAIGVAHSCPLGGIPYSCG
ncbi:hypothetical protein LZ30DRAFT_770957 [Colletotrichum cereale]|nr:hypothetical protein LZ30DRAFT_770957 [Colletotrichum cereale]